MDLPKKILSYDEQCGTINILNLPIGYFTVEKIAHALSNICRFGGRTHGHYSVAQHVVVMSYLTNDTELAYWFLHHDDAESIIGDIISPIKNLFSGIKKIEQCVLKQIARDLNLSWPPPWNKIKNADIKMRDGEVETIIKTKELYLWPASYAYERYLRRHYEIKRLIG